jgi:hypothetical protein
MISSAVRRRLLLATGLAGLALLWNGTVPFTGGVSLVSSANAIIGRPLTPMSYAGVARRTTRRAVAAGTVYAPGCTQAVNAYGQIVTVCR